MQKSYLYLTLMLCRIVVYKLLERAVNLIKPLHLWKTSRAIVFASADENQFNKHCYKSRLQVSPTCNYWCSATRVKDIIKLLQESHLYFYRSLTCK